MPELYNQLVDHETGEILGQRQVLSPGERAQKLPSKDQKDGWEYAQKEVIPLPSFLQEQFGNFVHSRYDALLKRTNYDTATAFRFIYLCTFMEYDTGYIQWKNKRINSHYLADIYGVHKNTVTNIKKKLFENELVFEDKDGMLYVNMEYCYRGDINNNKQYRQQCTRIFNNGIQSLYNNANDFRDHKMLGKLLLLLPYVNVWHNVICLNIKEKDWDKLVVPTSAQMDQIMHTSLNNNQKQMKKLLDIEVNGEPAVLTITHKNVRMYAINPRIYYGGTKLSDVQELSGMFAAKGGLD